MAALDRGIEHYLKDIEARVRWSSSGSEVDARRSRMEALAEALSPKRPPGVRVRDEFISLPGREVPVRVYKPNGWTSGPCIVFLHGGGWVVGSIESHDFLAAQLAEAIQCTVISVHYRRAPENPYPAPMDDCLEAILWARRNVDELGLAWDRVGIVGDSAGAYLALCCALRARQQQALRCRALALLYPVIAFRFDTDSYTQFASGPGLTLEDMKFYWNAFLSDECRQSKREFLHWTSEDLALLPATYLVAAEIDPLRDEALAFAADLKNSGVPVESHCAAGLIHGFFRAYDYSDKVRSETHRMHMFLRKQLKGTA